MKKSDAELCEWLRRADNSVLGIMQANHVAARIEELAARNAQLEDLVKSVAHISFDFGQGGFAPLGSHAKKSRELIEQGE
tara:strand:+ start:449 stop:688 length:240 start_codon:yes stop_codon:yes gene_type:complete